MTKINPEDWQDFSRIVRGHWPNIDEEELMSTEGYIELVEQLVESKSMDNDDIVKAEVKNVFDEVEKRKIRH